MSLSDADTRRKRATFRQLHAEGCFVLPNPWDVGSARYLQRQGFLALATTSAGCAWSEGRPDGAVSLQATLEHLRLMAAATPLPLNADFGDGFGASPSQVAEAVAAAIDTGIAALSIEDASGVADAPLRPIDDAVARLRAARAAIDQAGGEVLLVGRAENFFVGVPDLRDTLRRLRAYAEAGADVLYAPGISTPEQIRAVVAAAGSTPVNLLVGGPTPLNLKDIAALGVRRVSLGGALARAAWGGLIQATRPIVQDGRFDGLQQAAPGATLNALFQ
ncbi:MULTISPECIES: isocitrate lyase/phosphoenolpyruvate mutase family protein [Stenotrophomonas]|jgi:2-methylisocitrate lyase-like PEP mutase family enzyme|uniref:isocitrate lyase/PEP mutase family protein n=1 Tax=Stenotrophomonas TaxID=40323 RepID=UPI00201CFB8B|nr:MULTISPECIES: isocitrate lyase/phosphoenolpyruvate mutase family protein [Stenotrophomonas]MBN5025953.1 isocitrate lyase/phosphoenolpyruvate mutase family protein [Stenotrophomonas maltophilia]MDH1272041.1 isocitrate lyase/phosphoenolpyruvate mutase family protein [Stenotrophomonas sp. GD03937]MDH1484043.1 isocitrate lyase/phosphoenolpyruvate mutase family protein [Stenotrophomonas sp. GD03712]UQY94950.1 isocitrate lyase/phosphoenolpyruvate mutase family protein [Stenotrophomonas maltophilia